MTLYLDIEGTLVGKKGREYVPRPYLEEFLAYVKETFDEIFWLTAMGDEKSVKDLFASLNIKIASDTGSG